MINPTDANKYNLFGFLDIRFLNRSKSYKRTLQI